VRNSGRDAEYIGLLGLLRKENPLYPHTAKYQCSITCGSLEPTHGDPRHLSARIAAPTETLYAGEEATRLGS
jgi:hypothetical protein